MTALPLSTAAPVPIGSPPRPSAAPLSRDPGPAEDARAIVREAGQHVSIILALPQGTQREVLRSLLPALLDQVKPDVRVRILCTRHTYDRRLPHTNGGDGGGAEVRLARLDPIEAVMADGRTALANLRAETGSQIFTTQEVLPVQALHTLFNSIWKRSVPLSARPDFGDRRRTRLVAEILGMLRVGATDEVAARALSISVRTYRRHVADIMERLDARSRFEAGLLAAELDMLPPPAERD
ncbi:LuxR family transcriptional regulator [Streptomyces sp. 110]|uniref:LuxR family transcriptional regulator n=1 Tax=Streptomyces endocoffeicus TaxID=2898945 RepID=A0ABS1PWS1_9ACTN|nr:LuxR C-terminal-related transcriptional regulator [Streptomyces endocoffeicus]MBL1116881.1 LuxR family transcriptional regulator [Streptomyces endocoffeicus]